MDTSLIYAVCLLIAIGFLAALLLYFVAQKFYVYEDPKIDIVADKLPGANCGACGMAGCRDMAKALIGNPEGYSCPVCNSDEWAAIAEVLGIEAHGKSAQIAVVRCNGGLCNGINKVSYEGTLSCAFANSLFAGENSCPYSCLGCGDCVKACSFEAIKIDPKTKLPVVDASICGGCGSCAQACPRGIIEIRDKNDKRGMVYVACRNKDKGAIAMKYCKVSCIGCSKCQKVCPREAITIENNLAYIDYRKCISCKKCVGECPKSAIIDTKQLN